MRMIAAALLASATVLATTGHAQQMAAVVVVNECPQRLSLLVSAVPENGNRQTFGWFNLPARSNQNLFLADGSWLQHNTQMPFYIYATNADDSTTWSDNDLRVVWQNRSYNMQQRNLAPVEGTGPFAVRALTFAC
ncbi:hypothetical protein EOD42_01770 [Rhodovarius crocodyli]|uniref:DUF1036 domain-containing protein n=1 Tax=Rhodovarius crocodyli TaxID=1979269 RepID=A0A437MMI2_9PROT|nr:hypothetical protein [Rhodovarius crocodyli]RVT98867.1 hypothetical protein EOD42_01770 [Rhodovarius crocodyli]